MSFPLQLQTFYIKGQSIALFVPDVTAVQKAYQRGEISFPYWSKVWTSAIALSGFLLLHPHYVQNKTVVELGAGLGLPSLIAARYAANVLCTDQSTEAASVAKLSAKHHRLNNFQTAVLDWNYIPHGLEAEVLLLSDINYEPGAFATLLKAIAYFLSMETTIILSTPQRLMAKDFVAPLAVFCTRQEEIKIIEGEKEIEITVMVLQKLN